MGIAWWLVPTPACAAPLERAINESGVRHFAPTFPAHVTLFSASSISKPHDQIISSTSSVLASFPLPSNTLTLAQKHVEVGETFHQSVFLSLHSTAELDTLRGALIKTAASTTLSKVNSPHFPHASLYYGDGSAEDRHHVVAHLMDARALDIAGDGTVEVSGLPGEGITFASVWVMDIAGKNPSDWKIIVKMGLDGKVEHEQLTTAPAPVKESDAASSTMIASEPSAASSNGPPPSNLSKIAEKEIPAAKSPALPAATSEPEKSNGSAPKTTSTPANGKNATENEKKPAPAEAPKAKAKEGLVAKLKRLLCF